jgi:hypothetical protein
MAIRIFHRSVICEHAQALNIFYIPKAIRPFTLDRINGLILISKDNEEPFCAFIP